MSNQEVAICDSCVGVNLENQGPFDCHGRPIRRELENLLSVLLFRQNFSATQENFLHPSNHCAV